MKKIFVFSGTGENEKSIWYPWLKEKLKTKKYRMEIVVFPGKEKPNLADCLAEALKKVNPGDDSILIGHGSGCPVLLSYLEKSGNKVRKVILTAGFCEPTEQDANSRKMVQRAYDWEKIAACADEFVMINSRDNRLGYDDRYGSFMADKLNGRLLVGDDNEIEGLLPCGDFPLLWNVIEENNTF